MTQKPKVEWTLTQILLKDLKPHAKNPRQIGKDQFERLDGLIAKFGMIDKPIVNFDMTLIGGHQRIRVLKRRKQKTEYCWVSDRLLSDEEVNELMIGLNKFHGQFDYDILANEFEPLDLLKWGFSEEELLGICKTDINGKEGNKEKKKKMCPSCGCEF